MRRPSVSVCVPVYNGARYLEPCLRSIVTQTHRDFELLVVDDASTDGSWDLLRAWRRREPRLRLLRNSKNLGLVGNWNRCVKAARGAWVKFAFQDDFLKRDCLASMLGAVEPGDQILACRRALRFESSTPARIKALYREHVRVLSLDRCFPGPRRISPERFAQQLLRRPSGNCVGEPTAVLIKREAFQRYGYFNADLVSLCDWEFFARVAVQAGLRRVPLTLASFRVHAGAASAANWGRMRFRAETLDDLILRHAVAFAPGYERVRKGAEAARPRVDLPGSFEATRLKAKKKAARLGVTATRLYAEISRRYGPAPVSETAGLTAARALWKARGAVVERKR